MYCIIALILSGISTLLDIVGLAIPYWYHGNVNGVSVYFGLWTTCGAGMCASYAEVPTAISATRALEILGMLLLMATFVSAVLKQFVMKDKLFLTKIGAACAILGGLFMIIGAIVFATNGDLKAVAALANMKLNAGFALCIVSGVLALPAGVVMFLVKE